MGLGLGLELCRRVTGKAASVIGQTQTLPLNPPLTLPLPLPLALSEKATSVIGFSALMYSVSSCVAQSPSSGSTWLGLG